MNTIPLYSKNEYKYKTPGEWVPTLTAYIHEDEKTRPGLLVIPGGGYVYVSPSEGVIIAEKFYELGYNTFVVTYTVRVDEQCAYLGKQPLEDVSRAMRMIRANAGEYKVYPDKIAAIGFSAGGHLAGTLGVHADEDITGSDEVSARPDALILAYPVISSGKYKHAGTIENLVGTSPSEADLLWASVEKNVTKDTCPCFIWHTNPDDAVPVENSLLMNEALMKNGIIHELHVFATGHHGQSLATEYWKEGKYDCSYVLGQYESAVRFELDNHDGSFKPRFYDIDKVSSLEEAMMLHKENVLPSADARVNVSLQIWPELAHNFLKTAMDF